MILMFDGIMKYKLQSESTYRTYTYIFSGYLHLFDLFGCLNGFKKPRAKPIFSLTNICINFYRGRAFLIRKQKIYKNI